ncbi:hypothetical protein BDR07DRAFT_68350 [Suillus spraguei]|nr:hypothetical protein BDR07DRAFT_68350 [Suillus spraguei]
MTGRSSSGSLHWVWGGNKLLVTICRKRFRGTRTHPLTLAPVARDLKFPAVRKGPPARYHCTISRQKGTRCSTTNTLKPTMPRSYLLVLVISTSWKSDNGQLAMPRSAHRYLEIISSN